MAATAYSHTTIYAAVSSPSSSTTVRARGPPSCPNFFIPKISPNPFALNLSKRLKICRRTSKASTNVVIASCLVDDNSEAYAESGKPYVSTDSRTEAMIDIKLPRRSLLVHFTCNACGERSQKLISRLAYERGTVFVQCSGCLQHHKLVDNLGLVVEYDFREETSGEPNADQV
ncbi:hypothetical protein LguiA_000508 [Lonicera macranthoides]